MSQLICRYTFRTRIALCLIQIPSHLTLITLRAEALAGHIIKKLFKFIILVVWPVIFIHINHLQVQFVLSLKEAIQLFQLGSTAI